MDDVIGAATSAPGPPPFRKTPHLPRRDADDDDTVDPRFHPRARIEVLTFYGKEDPLPLLNRYETFFRCQNTPQHRRVPDASLHLIGSAQLWFYRLELMTGTPSYFYFAQLVQQCFGPPMMDSLVDKIMLLHRDGTVDDYTDKFLALACCNADLTESQLVQMYTAGLVNPLKTDVTLCHPASLDDAIMLARAYEQRLHLSSTDPGPTRGTRSLFQSSSTHMETAPPASSSATPHDTASSATTGSGKTTSLASTLPCRRLSPADMTQRRAEGLCYNCDEKFVAGHQCKKLLVIEIIGFDDSEETAEAATISAIDDTSGISLHVITGVQAHGCHDWGLATRLKLVP